MAASIGEHAPSRNATRPSGRRSLVLSFLSGAALALAGAWLLGSPSSRTPPLPTLNLAGVDPAIGRAIEQAQTAVRTTPRSAAAWGRLGMVLLTHEFTAEAKPCFLHAEQLDPGEPRWPYFLSMAEHEDDPGAALADLQRAVEGFGENELAPRLRLADELLAQDHASEAENQLGHVLQQDPHHAFALLSMARLALRRGRVQEALHYAQRCRGEVGPSKSISLLLAEVYQQLGDRTAAAQEARQAVALRDDPPRPDPFVDELARLRTGERVNLKRAQALLDAGRLTPALALLQHLVQAYPESASCWLTLSRVQGRLRQWSASEEALAKALQLAPQNPEIHVQRGIAWYFQDDPRAEAAFRQAIQLKPDCAPAYYNLGLWLAKQHHVAEAIDAFRTAVRLQPDLADAYLGLGSLLASTSQLPEAVQALQRAVELQPANPRARQVLKQTLVRVAATIPP